MVSKMIGLAVALVVSTTALTEARQAPDGRKGFDRLKELAGTWRMSGQGARGVMTYRLSPDGKTLVQDEAGQLTVITLDGEALTLVHYCARGNQPRMRLQTMSDARITFKMFDITNLSHPRTYHTTDMELVFLSRERVDLIYRGISDGRVSTQVVHLARMPS